MSQILTSDLITRFVISNFNYMFLCRQKLQVMRTYCSVILTYCSVILISCNSACYDDGLYRTKHVEDYNSI
jgi:hypothetical protein